MLISWSSSSPCLIVISSSSPTHSFLISFLYLPQSSSYPHPLLHISASSPPCWLFISSLFHRPSLLISSSSTRKIFFISSSLPTHFFFNSSKSWSTSRPLLSLALTPGESSNFLIGRWQRRNTERNQTKHKMKPEVSEWTNKWIQIVNTTLTKHPVQLLVSRTRRGRPRW